MTRRLVVCADGTWNTPDETSEAGEPTPTNVAKMMQALTARADQRLYYHKGVGTAGGLDHYTGGMFGAGIDANIKDCYRWLVETYDVAQDNEIFLFGFSRGAYTVRSLAGMIRNVGLLKPENVALVDQAYEFYRERGDDSAPRAARSIAFREQYSNEVNVTFIGVWDTVGALGIPVHILQFLNGDRYEFHDVTLSSTVKYAYQALAINEERSPFEPCVWEQQQAANQDLQQVWFTGVHSNIGGGYTNIGVSDLTFDWMRRRAAAAGLTFDTAFLQTIKPDGASGTIYDSMAPMYYLFGRFVRRLRDERTDENGNPIDTRESLHVSALQRWGNDIGYTSPQVDEYLKRFTSTDPGVVTT